MTPNKSPEPTAVGAVSSAVAGSRRESAVAQLSTLGCYTFMQNTLLILLSGLLLCGCSKMPATSAHPASDLIVAGTNIAWSDGSVLYVTKRDGTSLEGIRVVHTDASGQVATITADKGTVELGFGTTTTRGVVTSTNVVFILLQDAHFQSDTTNQVIKELSLHLHQ